MCFIYLTFCWYHLVWESNIFSLSASAKVTSKFKILCHTNNTPLAGPTFGKHLLFFNIFSIKSPSIRFSKWKLIICYLDRSKPTSFTLESATSRKLSQAVYCCLLSMTKSPSWNYKPEPSRSECCLTCTAALNEHLAPLHLMIPICFCFLQHNNDLLPLIHYVLQ